MGRVLGTGRYSPLQPGVSGSTCAEGYVLLDAKGLENVCEGESLFPLAPASTSWDSQGHHKVKLETALALQLQGRGRSPRGGDRQMLMADRGSNKVRTASQSVLVRSQGDWRGMK